MGLFSKKPPCPICGGKISWFFPSKIEGEYVCSDCYGKIDMESAKVASLTMQGFREYLVYYDQNQFLKNKFVVSARFDFGFFNTKIIFDYQNKLFCLSGEPNKTVFEGKHLKSFTIMEDKAPLIKGSAAGIKRYASTVPERARAMAPQISQYLMNKQLSRTLDMLDDGKENRSISTPNFDLPEPFCKFYVELRFDHPYWTVVDFNMDGPRFNNEYPDVEEYIRSYQSKIEEINRLVTALQTVAFPNAPDKSVGSGPVQVAEKSANLNIDPIEEIKKYKALMEAGTITPQEFEAKKKQILGI